MGTSNDIILVAGILCVLSILAGQLSARVGTPLLLVFIGIGMLAGEDGPGGIPFDDFGAAYLLGSLALAVILFEGGLGTKRSMLRRALWPAAALATGGVAISAGLVGAAGVVLFGVSWPEALLLGAALAPTDAAAVTVLLRQSQVAVPARVVAVLEVESGLNDPMSVFITLTLLSYITAPDALGITEALLSFLEEMAGGAVIGLAGGYILLWLFRRLTTESTLFPVLAFGGALALFGGAQTLGASGFLAVYLAGLVVGNHNHQAGPAVRRFFGALGWLAQISLFLMLGLLVTPHDLPQVVLPGLAVAAILIVIARPVAVFACLAPFRWSARETTFVSWVGLRGAVPIYLTVISLLAGLPRGHILFDIAFVVVIASIAVQGWTISPVARLLGLRAGTGEEASED